MNKQAFNHAFDLGIREVALYLEKQAAGEIATELKPRELADYRLYSTAGASAGGTGGVYGGAKLARHLASTAKGIIPRKFAPLAALAGAVGGGIGGGMAGSSLATQSVLRSAASNKSRGSAIFRRGNAQN